MRVALLTTLITSLLASITRPGCPAADDPTPARGKELRVAIVGAHSDSPESGCGGLTASDRGAAPSGSSSPPDHGPDGAARHSPRGRWGRGH
jgi:hypothetical protein